MLPGMGTVYVQGDIFLSRAPALGLGTNTQGAVESSPLAAAFLDRYPAAFAAYRKQARAGRIRPGDVWVWREAAPWLVLLAVRTGPSGATRPRHVEAAMQRLARDWQREGLRGLAVTCLGDDTEWPYLRPVIDLWLANSPLPIVIYEAHRPGVWALEPWSS